MQSQVQMTKLKREYDELLAKNKKLSSSTAKAARVIPLSFFYLSFFLLKYF